jgi:hypothetical protein
MEIFGLSAARERISYQIRLFFAEEEYNKN